jgi:hypothetical protein
MTADDNTRACQGMRIDLVDFLGADRRGVRAVGDHGDDPAERCPCIYPPDPWPLRSWRWAWEQLRIPWPNVPSAPER